MKNFKRILALTLALIMCVAMFAACGETKTPSGDNGDEVANDTPLVVGYAPFSSKFSPFFSETAYDQDVQAMTQLGLLTSDRTGAIILKGIEGETIEYNGTPYTYNGPADLTITQNDDGTVYYDFVLRDDITFSDGEKLTVDDVIFSMYVLCDPTYDGSSTLFAVPIQGMNEYRSGMDSRLNLVLATEKAGYTANDYFTEEQYNTFWAAFDAAGVKFAQEIIDYCVAEYADAYAETYLGVTADEVRADVALQVKLGMFLWGYDADWVEGATAADYWNAIVAAKGYDLSDNGINYETAGTSISAFLNAELGDKAAEYAVGLQTGESAANISGIQKTGENSLRVVLTKVDATAIYQLGVAIAPLHYYGSDDLYDYENNKFGFVKGDLSSVRAKTTQPMGAGPYKFVEFKNGVVYFEANESYFLGTPKTKYVQFMETASDDDKLNGVITGTIDISDPSIDEDTVDAIKKANDGELSGSKVYTNTVDNLGYGYLGIDANLVSVGGDGASDASKNLRKALATVFSVYRDVAVDSYYGERATVINYPISNTSWAAPQATDDGYKVAFSTDVEGNAIYTSEMTADEKYAAALTAALGYFEAAGYTVEDGKLTAAPEGAALQYELWIPADGKGDHPAFMMVSLADDALATIGFDLVVKDLANSDDLWSGLEAEEVAMWCAAWGATVDPDMYQIYFSGNDTMAAGGSNYMYDIDDDELNQLILDARTSLDQAYRKTMYKACLDIVVDWAVEVPVYQRQNAIIFSAERVNLDTITPDITTFYGWMAEIQNLEMK